jgi:cell wall-associated NlpC family hydrolase
MSALAEAARTFIGAKFRHRGRSPKMMDCVGLGLLAYEKCGVTLPDYRLYQPDPIKHGPNLTEYVKRALGDPVAVEPVKYSDMQDGDVVVIRYVHEPHHVAIVGQHPLGYLSLIHAHGLYGRVLEQGMPPGVALDHGAVITHVFRRPV